ncbi:MAG: DUF4325 domain-containing protein [Clostridia bacterium]|nr:DUF4325 domain-containing protein [Clostridia bacterium]
MANINREQIMQYMLKQIHAHDRDIVAKTVEYFGISKSTVYNYLKKMCDDGIVQKTGDALQPYQLISKKYEYQYQNDGSLSEDRVFDKDIAQHFSGYEKNVLSAWRYAFTEMMNNAIEHSEAKEILVIVSKNAFDCSIILYDDGIGIFKNIQRYMKNEKNEELTLDECVALLFAGKFTTAKHLHSGEGIFFTSHLMDKFLILSDEICFTRDNFHDVQLSGFSVPTGTAVYMALSNQSKKTAREVFDRFSNVEEGFIRTQIPIAHVFPNGNPVSRSEARRLGELILRFKEIDLDFANVEEVGQAFVHEMFVVWQHRNPEIQLNVCNANQAVESMIKRVKNTQ